MWKRSKNARPGRANALFAVLLMLLSPFPTFLSGRLQARWVLDSGASDPIPPDAFVIFLWRRSASTKTIGRGSELDVDYPDSPAIPHHSRPHRSPQTYSSMAGPSSTNKPYAEASHPAGGDGVPAKATSKPSTDKHEALRSLHRDPNMSEEAIHNRATSGPNGSSGTKQNQGQTHGSVKANHGAGGPGRHPTTSANYTDGSASMADQVSLMSRDW